MALWSDALPILQQSLCTELLSVTAGGVRGDTSVRDNVSIPEGDRALCNLGGFKPDSGVPLVPSSNRPASSSLPAFLSPFDQSGPDSRGGKQAIGRGIPGGVGVVGTVQPGTGTSATFDLPSAFE
jgi:hypothetical protein